MVAMSNDAGDSVADPARRIRPVTVDSIEDLYEFAFTARGPLAVMRITFEGAAALMRGRFLGFRVAMVDHVPAYRLCFDPTCERCFSLDEPFAEFTINEVAFRVDEVFVVYRVAFHNVAPHLLSAAPPPLFPPGVVR